MNEKDFKQLDKLAADALNEIGNEDFDRVNMLKIGQLLRINKTFIDVVRQLTIANEIAGMRGVNELRSQQGLAVAYPEGSFDNVFDKPTPPDALVEAGNKMADFIDTWEDTLAGNQMTQEDFDVDCGLPEWKAALAAHKKAVR